jgi:uncharacterized membrane protein HdeD (DUF308 family)
MASEFPYFLSPDAREMEVLKGKSLWTIALGVVLIALGLLALAFPVVATLASTTFFGVLLLIGGVLQIAGAFGARGWGGFFLYLLLGLLSLFVGVVLVERPLISAVELTLVLAVFFVAGGLFRLVGALSQRFSGWGWSALNGAVTLLLGVLIWRGWPGDGLGVIGTLVGIDLLFNGWTLVMLGLAVRSASKAALDRVAK